MQRGREEYEHSAAAKYEGWNFNSGNYLFTTDQNRYMFRSFTVLHCSHQHCVQPVASDVEVVGYL